MIVAYYYLNYKKATIINYFIRKNNTMNVIEETVKKYIIEKGFPVELVVEDYDNSYTLKEDFWDPNGVNVIYDHFNHCELVVPELEKLTTVEKSVYSFAGTFNDPDQNILLGVIGDNDNHIHCDCGEYDKLSIVVDDSLTNIINNLMNIETLC